MHQFLTRSSPSTFSIWRDESEEPQQCEESRVKVNGKPAVSRPLALRSSNVPLKSNLGRYKVAVSAKDEKACETHSVPYKAGDVSKLTLDSLGDLPERIKKLFIEQSFHDPQMLSNPRGLLAAADAFKVRSILMRTEVPLTALTPPARTPYSMKEDNSLVSDLNVPFESMIETEQVPRAHAFKDCMPPLNTVTVDSSSLIAPPPTRTVTPMLSLYATVKISNIPWDIATEQITEFLGKNARIAQYTSICCPAHFVLDRTSGKTQSEIFLEFTSISDAERFAQRKSGKCLGSRVVEIELVSSKEMLDAIFPRLRNGVWVTREEIQNVITHAKTFKSPYTRKCPQRPFENFISLLSLFPWANHSAYAPSQVESLFQGYTTLISILQWHIRKGKITGLNTTLLRRLVIAGTNLTDFSSEQKRTVCHAVRFYPEVVCPLVDEPMTSLSPSEHGRCYDDDSVHQHTARRARPSSNSLPKSLPSIQINDRGANEVQTVPNLTCDTSQSLTRDSAPSGSHIMVPGVFTKACDVVPTTDLVESLSVLFSSATRSNIFKSTRYPTPASQTASKKFTQASRAVQDQDSSTKQLYAPSPQQQWLLNAQRAGIAVKLPLSCSNRA